MAPLRTGLALYLTWFPSGNRHDAYENDVFESQERMLTRPPGREKTGAYSTMYLDARYRKVVEGDRLRIVHNGKVEADMPVMALTDEAPKYNRPMSGDGRRETGDGSRQDSDTPGSVPASSDLNNDLRTLLASPNICSKHWVYEQYDSMVLTNTRFCRFGCGGDPCEGNTRAIAMCLDGPWRYVAVNAKEGASWRCCCKRP